MHPIFGTVHLLTADTQLGRVNLHMLSDQTLMEILVEGFSELTKEKLQEADGTFRDVCQWTGVKCDDNGRVVVITRVPSNGPIDLKYIPPHVVVFDMFISELSGALETSLLPEHMVNLSLGGNEFRGTFDFASLPKSLAELSIYSNQFAGSAALDRLPEAMVKIWMQGNNFSGEICLKCLPPGLQFLNISDNRFTVFFYLENAPEVFHMISYALRLEGTAVVPKRLFVDLFQSGVTAVVDEDGNRHESEEKMLFRP